MKILKVTAKNFYSFNELELDLTKYKGIVRINGKNKDTGGDSSNGAGKSSIFEAITWGLFNRTIRKSTEESLVNNRFGRDTEVCIQLEKNGSTFEIRRAKRPTSFNVTVDAESINKESALETQKYLEEILATDYKSFLASVVFGQHSDSTFLDSSAEEKRNIIKNCFNLDEFFSKRTAIKELKSKYSSEFKIWSTIVDTLRKDKNNLSGLIPDKKYKYVELPSLESILQAEKRINELDIELKNLSSDRRKVTDSLKKIKEAISKGAYKEEKECPVCKSIYCKEQNMLDVVEMTKEEIRVRSDLEILEHNENAVKNQIEQIKPQYSSFLWSKYNDKNKLVLEAQKHIDKFTEVSNQLDENETKLKTLEQKVDVMKFWELAFSEKGIIKYIIRNILDYFNGRSNEYLSILTNNQFTIEFSDELTETIKNNGVEVKFVSLSGGEKRKTNLAIMLALQDLSSKVSRTDCNLVFFDEVCDNIDSFSIGSIHNLLNTLTEQYSDKILLLITHNQKLNELLHESQEINVIKEKGISRIV